MSKGDNECGARAVGGPCILLRGHNMGQADVPSQHHWEARPTEADRLTADLQAAHAVIAEMQARHQRLGRPHIASCTCGKVICPDLTLLDKIQLPNGEVK